jgi:hypothetical protein
MGSATLFLAEIYVIKPCVMTDIERGYTGRNMYILFDVQSAVKGPDNFQVNSESVWYCHQSIWCKTKLLKLGDYCNIKRS